MTREEAINILIAVAVCSTEYLYCDEHCPFYSPRNMKNGCNVWNDELVKEAVETISALRQQDHFRDVTKKVEPLSLDKLRKMDGEPVWVQSPGVPEYGRWAIVEGVGENCLFLHDDFTCHDYGKTWLAYRHKPEEGTD